MKRNHQRQRRPRHIGPAQCWAAIRQLRRFTLAQLEAVVPRRTAQRFIQALLDAGVVTGTRVQQSNAVRFTEYELIRDLGRRCPRFDGKGGIDPRPTAQERLWAAMRPLRGGFVLAELIGLTRVKEETARSYVAALRRAGYLDMHLVNRHQGARFYRYVLVRDRYTGPEPPVVLADGAVWDANLNRIVWSPSEPRDGQEEAA